MAVGAAQSLDQTKIEIVCLQTNPSNDGNHITHMQSVLGKKYGNVHIQNVKIKWPKTPAACDGTGSSVKISENWSRPIPSIGLGWHTTTIDYK